MILSLIASILKTAALTRIKNLKGKAFRRVGISLCTSKWKRLREVEKWAMRCENVGMAGFWQKIKCYCIAPGTFYRCSMQRDFCYFTFVQRSYCGLTWRPLRTIRQKDAGELVGSTNKWIIITDYNILFTYMKTHMSQNMTFTKSNLKMLIKNALRTWRIDTFKRLVNYVIN